MKKKKIFTEATLEVYDFQKQDVITTSGGNPSGGIVLPDDEW